MKKSITGAVALLAGAVIAHGQGQVSFSDFYNSNPLGYTSVAFNGSAVGGTALHTGTSADTGVGSDWTVQLYGAPGQGDALSVVEASPAQLDGAAVGTAVTATLDGGGTGTSAGQWFSTAIGDINGAAGGSVATVAVAAWYNNGGTITSITAAQAGGFANGWSAPGNIALGTAPSTPPLLPNLGGTIATVGNVGGGGTVGPEPSTIALGVMGAGAFLARLRKK
ncbi:MAG TPA: hypothetical protein VGO67_08530 [Verrucomicrobiae bacterium]|jgi:hypothetical protein